MGYLADPSKVSTEQAECLELVNHAARKSVNWAVSHPTSQLVNGSVVSSVG